ncbi:MAG: hypothetical protein ITG02_07550 [Patulibacter sp.]|nr:hypothetical protein [Patulibacter sp.]
MSSEFDANDDAAAGEPTDGLSLRALEDQINERMSKLYGAAEEYYKLQVLLDTIDGRDVLPVPDYLVGRVAEPSLPDEQRRRQARERAVQRMGLVAPRRRR